MCDYMHSIKYPPGYLPRDNLDARVRGESWERVGGGRRDREGVRGCAASGALMFGGGWGGDEGRFLWGQMHSLKCPPGYLPRDNLDARVRGDDLGLGFSPFQITNATILRRFPPYDVCAHHAIQYVARSAN